MNTVLSLSKVTVQVASGSGGRFLIIFNFSLSIHIVYHINHRLSRAKLFTIALGMDLAARFVPSAPVKKI